MFYLILKIFYFFLNNRSTTEIVLSAINYFHLNNRENLKLFYLRLIFFLITEETGNCFICD